MKRDMTLSQSVVEKYEKKNTEHGHVSSVIRKENGNIYILFYRFEKRRPQIVEKNRHTQTNKNLCSPLFESKRIDARTVRQKAKRIDYLRIEVYKYFMPANGFQM